MAETSRFAADPGAAPVRRLGAGSSATFGQRTIEERIRRHVFRLEYAWIDQPMAVD